MANQAYKQLYRIVLDLLRAEADDLQNGDRGEYHDEDEGYQVVSEEIIEKTQE